MHSFRPKQTMILFRNGLITLEYDPAADILFVDWPDILPYNLTDVRETLLVLLDTIRVYDIKNILIDSRRSVVELNEEEHEALMLDFARDLKSTRLQRMARLRTNDPVRESRVTLARKKSGTSIDYQEFKDEAAAMEWLKSRPQPVAVPTTEL